jgi:TolB-like protein/Flp pilus assembly protein TadD
MSAEQDREPALARASMPAGAIFLSYASEDAAAAERIATALRAAGIEVWFDKSELRGGDAWDRQIRSQIHECALFLAIISAHSDARKEGYFRREWKLAVERTADMAEDVPFLLPVVIDGTKDATARVPERFREVQWSHLPEAEPSAAFIERARRLLSPELSKAPSAFHGGIPRSPSISGRAPRAESKAWVMAAGLVAAVAVGYFAFDRLAPKHAAPSAPVSAPSPAAASFSPPPHSIAVLPFVNMSGDKEQEYFSDGLSEELLNDLSRINELHVAARTSAFSFKGKDTDIGTIARKLNVGSVLEGSVRRSGHRIRVTAQLINAVTGFHLWSETYDRDLSDVLNLQSEIATAVTSALKVSLLSDVAGKVELGGTRSPEAFDAYLRGQQAILHAGSEQELRDAIAAFSKAILLDPAYAGAFAVRSRAFNDVATQYATTSASIHEALDEAESDARKALALAPSLDESHLALALFYQSTLNFAGANDEYDRAMALSPSNVRTLWRYSIFNASMGRTEAGIAAARRSVALDPLEWVSRLRLGQTLYLAREYKDALTAFKDVQTLSPDRSDLAVETGTVYYAMGDFQRARLSCESRAEDPQSLWCLAISYDKLGRNSDAEAALTKLKALWGEGGATVYAAVYAQRGNVTKSVEWLDTAMRMRDPTLITLRMDPLFDPLRNEPRFKAIQRELKFPD